MSHPAIFPTIGHQLFILPTVDSTNNYAMGQVQEGRAAHGTVYFALEQTAGKGQRGRRWITLPGQNIMMSTVLQPAGLPLSNQFIVSAAIALACYDFFKNYAGDETRIKWPNDVYWRDRKAGGILIENRISAPENTPQRGPQPAASWAWAIAGTGININQVQFDSGIQRAVSLKQITGKDFEVVELAKELCQRLQQRWEMVMKEKMTATLLEHYQAALYKRTEKVKLRKGNTVFETTITGVTAQGELLTKDVLERQFQAGEIEWVFDQ